MSENKEWTDLLKGVSKELRDKAFEIYHGLCRAPEVVEEAGLEAVIMGYLVGKRDGAKEERELWRVFEEGVATLKMPPPAEEMKE